LTDLGAKAIVVPAGADLPARDVARRLGVTVMDLDSSTTPLAGGFTLAGASTAVDAPTDWGRNEDTALVLHTSGTTSRPKQVPLSHRNLCSSAGNIAGVLGLTAADRCLNVMPLFHIHGLAGALLSSMFAGGAVVCSAGYDNGTFAALMRDFEPTWYSAVPTIHQSVLALAKAQPAVAEGGHLRLIRSSSSSLPPSVMAALEETFRVPVIESYGMTEAAHQMASNPMPAAARKPGSVGLPAGPQMACMDDDGNLLPSGETGEVVIRGANVTAGYANNPEANETAFTNGWFRTGDVGHFDEDGYLLLRGRKKEMINRGGENISPREIDEAFLAHPAVAQAVAFAVPHPTLGEDVTVAVVLHPEATATENELRRFAFERLAPFKVPSRVVVVPAIPKGPTGKLQRIGLYGALRDELTVEHVAPRNDLEKSVVAVFEEILQTTPVGATDNFFSLGGDSLKATRVIAKLSSEFLVELPAVSLFLNPTAEELVLEITRLLGEDSGMLEELLAEIESMTDKEARRLE
jgi:acyl-CoA synthetase (AMP-forming)/AMP-acid ligase II/acyl carrier protein